MTIAFLFCVEPGFIEPQAPLLAASIRRWGGRFAQSPIHAFNPRGAGPLPPELRKTLDKLGVELHEQQLNTEHVDYPYCNKIHACAWAEAELDAKTLVFLDTDTVFVNEPLELDLADGVDLALQPVVGEHGECSTGPGHVNDNYWIRSHELCEVPEAGYVETMRGGVRIRAYFNAGLVAVRREAGLFRRWEDFFSRFWNSKHILRKKTTNLDQHALAMVAASVWDKTVLLDHRYNYAIPQRARFLEPARSAPICDLIHLHYHRWFNVPRFLHRITPTLTADDPRVQWLDEWLPLEPHFEEEPFGPEPTKRGEREEIRSKWRGGTT